MTPAEINSALFDILTLRTSPAYHAAEVMRRDIGEVEMANSPPGSERYGNIRLLIGTWETIALRVRPNPPLKIPFYDKNPVGHMWQALEPAIKIIRKEKLKIIWKGKPKLVSLGVLYARQFQLLNGEYMTWLVGQGDEDYKTAQLGGIHAQFG